MLAWRDGASGDRYGRDARFDVLVVQQVTFQLGVVDDEHERVNDALDLCEVFHRSAAKYNCAIRTRVALKAEERFPPARNLGMHESLNAKRSTLSDSRVEEAVRRRDDFGSERVRQRREGGRLDVARDDDAAVLQLFERNLRHVPLREDDVRDRVLNTDRESFKILALLRVDLVERKVLPVVALVFERKGHEHDPRVRQVSRHRLVHDVLGDDDAADKLAVAGASAGDTLHANVIVQSKVADFDLVEHRQAVRDVVQ
jgi:hypothetical protein